MSFHRPPAQLTTQNEVPTYVAQELTGDGDLAHIQLDGQTYTLRITRSGKLILTK
ncbi:hemin uptake protein HemP [Sulfitobacter sp. EhC04]|uniref:hemin uptake protein HemP n=1 Tax=Sulfitobacter sp. EhC04 TaxID=1849168 RepID=UPI0009EE4C02|nr:hemin uptake protein HemP [Sulfitobacter sp. EhC04]